MSNLIRSIEEEFHRYKALGESAIAQLEEHQLSRAGSSDDNSIAVIVWHIAGNLASRFTEFQSSDGEKPWRNRDEEFAPRTVTKADLLTKWDSGWKVLLEALGNLSDEQLRETVTIRGQSLRIDQALHRSLAHTAYHVGQIVYVAKSLRGAGWRTLSIPRGGSAAYNSGAIKETPSAHAAMLSQLQERDH